MMRRRPIKLCVFLLLLAFGAAIVNLAVAWGGMKCVRLGASNAPVDATLVDDHAFDWVILDRWVSPFAIRFWIGLHFPPTSDLNEQQIAMLKARGVLGQVNEILPNGSAQSLFDAVVRTKAIAAGSKSTIEDCWVIEHCGYPLKSLWGGVHIGEVDSDWGREGKPPNAPESFCVYPYQAY